MPRGNTPGPAARDALTGPRGDPTAAAARPPMSDLTARTLRKAHAIARAYRELGEPLPAGIARLDRDYAPGGGASREDGNNLSPRSGPAA